MCGGALAGRWLQPLPPGDGWFVLTTARAELLEPHFAPTAAPAGSASGPRRGEGKPLPRHSCAPALLTAARWRPCPSGAGGRDLVITSPALRVISSAFGYLRLGTHPASDIPVCVIELFRGWRGVMK